MQVEIFHHFDKNDDGSLDLQEFLSMLKRTPLKIRQVRLSDHEESHLLKSWC
jgi:Ca2+-binding EF-hand superfamily protein